MVEYGQQLATSKSQSKPHFLTWLCGASYASSRDDRLLLPPPPGNVDPPYCEFGNLHDLITVHGRENATRLELSLKYHLEDVIVLPDNV